MPEPLSIFELVANASVLVQIVMLILALASVASWVMIFQRWFFLRRVLASVDEFEEHFWSGIDLRQLYLELESNDALTGIETVFVSGFGEYTRLSEQSGVDAEAIMQGAQRAMRVALNREEESLETHLAFLATVGSTSPYVGLFGTVWGIMNSFRSLANMSQATLALAGLRRLASLDWANDTHFFCACLDEFSCGRRLGRRLFREQVSGGPLLALPATDGATVLGQAFPAAVDPPVLFRRLTDQIFQALGIPGREQRNRPPAEIVVQWVDCVGQLHFDVPRATGWM